jgi:L1 cell adhesion molecule like protein
VDAIQRVIDNISAKIVDSFVDFQFTSPAKQRPAGKNGDGIEVYARDVLSLGVFYWEYSDSIREGDGERLLCCWRYMLPIFVNTGRRNYSIEALRLLYQHEYQFTPRQATQLLYSRFINTHGCLGHNVAADLHTEHLNAVAKGCIKGLGANKTEVAIQRSAKALGTILPVLEQFDTQNNVPSISGAHKRASTEKDQAIIVSELQKAMVFDVIPGRQHEAFSNLKNALCDKKTTELTAWITDRL